MPAAVVSDEFSQLRTEVIVIMDGGSALSNETEF